MMVHPFDSAMSSDEWKEWLSTTDRFGILAVNNLDRSEAPIVVPTHFTLIGEEIILHLARPNSVWRHLVGEVLVTLTVIGDYAFIPGYWRAAPGVPLAEGVPTSYYGAVNFVCLPTIVDDPVEKASIIAAQLEDMQPEGQHADMAAESSPYGRMLASVRGLRLKIMSVDAKFKYDDHKPIEHRERVSGNLEERGRPLDHGTSEQQKRRLGLIGNWDEFRAHRENEEG